jgi:hypothetical protein
MELLTGPPPLATNLILFAVSNPFDGPTLDAMFFALFT